MVRYKAWISTDLCLEVSDENLFFGLVTRGQLLACLDETEKVHILLIRTFYIYVIHVSVVTIHIACHDLHVACTVIDSVDIDLVGLV